MHATLIFNDLNDSLIIGVVGLGGVGLLLAYFLNRAGYVPYAVVRTRYERYVIRFDGEHVVRVRLVDRLPSDVRYTLIAVKAYDTVSIIDKVVGAPVVFQNGIGGLELVREGVGVVDRLGIRLPSDPFGEVLRVAEATRDNYSSMLQDILNRRRTEVDYINGAIVLRGREVGVDAPVNYTLWLLVRALEGGPYK